MELQVERVTTGQWKQNCYIAFNRRKQALIIDPGAEPDVIQRCLGEARIQPVGILGTHAHHDHVGAVAELRDRFTVPFYLHQRDLRLLKRANLYNLFLEPEPFRIAIPPVDHFFDQCSNPMEVGAFEVTWIETPGHTPGSTCLLVGHHLFVGDTLYKGGIGEVRPPDGDQDQLRESLRVLAGMSPDLHLHPGHGPVSTLGVELQTNIAWRRALE